MDFRSSRTFARDAAVATATLLVLYGLLDVGGALVIPGYLLVVGFDLLETAFGSAGSAYPVLFGAYLVGLGLLAATGASLLGPRLPDVAGWRPGVGGAVGLAGVGALLFALGILVGTAQLGPVLVTGTAGLLLLALAGWLLGATDGTRGSPAK
jgi:hypothetical protein